MEWKVCTVHLWDGLRSILFGKSDWPDNEPYGILVVVKPIQCEYCLASKRAEEDFATMMQQGVKQLTLPLRKET